MRTFDPQSPSNTYSASEDVDFVEGNLLEIMYIIGYSEQDLTTITIDEIIEGIRSVFSYTRLLNTEYENTLTAEETLRNANCILLTSCARRLWYRYNLAKAV